MRVIRRLIASTPPFSLGKPYLHPFVAAQIYHRRASAEGNVYFISVAVPILNG